MNLHDFLQAAGSAKIVQLRSSTEVRMLAKGKSKFPLGVTKISVRNGIIGASYENSVNNQLEREGQDRTFVAEQLWKGKGRKVTKFLVEHIETRRQYVCFKPSDIETKNIYIDNNSGCEIQYSDIKEFLPERKEPTNQGTEKPVFWQTIATDSILGIKCGQLEFVKR